MKRTRGSEFQKRSSIFPAPGLGPEQTTWGTSQVSVRFGTNQACSISCGVEMWRGGVGAAYRLPALSSAGASLASPCFRFHIRVGLFNRSFQPHLDQMQHGSVDDPSSHRL